MLLSRRGALFGLAAIPLAAPAIARAQRAPLMRISSLHLPAVFPKAGLRLVCRNERGEIMSSSPATAEDGAEFGLVKFKAPPQVVTRAGVHVPSVELDGRALLTYDELSPVLLPGDTINWHRLTLALG